MEQLGNDRGNAPAGMAPAKPEGLPTRAGMGEDRGAASASDSADGTGHARQVVQGAAPLPRVALALQHTAHSRRPEQDPGQGKRGHGNCWLVTGRSAASTAHRGPAAGVTP